MAAANPFKMDCIDAPRRDSRGYGRSYKGDKKLYSHRVAYEEAFGPIGPKRIIHHLCGNKGCVEPDHLISITQSEHATMFGARMTKLTHCLRGHPRTKENVTRSGDCRLCDNERGRAYRRRKSLR